MLAWNQRKLRQLSPVEIWLFIVGRVLIGFGIGVLAVRLWPDVVGGLGWPAVAAGFACLLVAAKGFPRQEMPPESPAPPPAA